MINVFWINVFWIDGFWIVGPRPLRVMAGLVPAMTIWGR
jgi:hypothetical protein